MKTLIDRFSTRYKLFLDLDGTLADFDKRVHELTGLWPWEMDQATLWGKMEKVNNFFAELEWMPYGEALWHFCKPLKPTILTGIPDPDKNLGDWGEQQKRLWCARKLGVDVPMIACRAKHKIEKAKEVTPPRIIPIIVDDWEKFKPLWEQGGGIFIHHKDTDHSIVKLLGIGML